MEREPTREELDYQDDFFELLDEVRKQCSTAASDSDPK